MPESHPILLTLTPRHFSPPQGKAYPVVIRHPEVLRRIAAGTSVTLWIDGAWQGRAADGAEDVVANGGGRCFVEVQPIELRNLSEIEAVRMERQHSPATAWLSLPDDADPRQRAAALVVRLGARTEPASPKPGPLLILGPQRSGTTAMQVALHVATHYRAPTDINRHSGNTLEGFHFAQVALRLVSHRLLSCFGSDSHQMNLSTGVFDDGGMADLAVQSLAEHVMRMYNLSACAAGQWTDKCPGWEATVLGPLFAAMFPGARVMFMARDPVSCALSIARLESSLPESLDDDRAVLSIARNSAVWTVSHMLWRRYARPRLPQGQWLEVPFETFRDQPEAVQPSVARLLELSSRESEQFIAALGRVRLPRHPIDSSSLDARIAALIGRLCRDEALRGSTALPETVRLDETTVAEACRLFRIQVERMLTWHSIRPAVVSAIADRLVHAAMHPQEALREEEPLPEPGPLLGARLFAGGGSIDQT